MTERSFSNGALGMLGHARPRRVRDDQGTKC